MESDHALLCVTLKGKEKRGRKALKDKYTRGQRRTQVCTNLNCKNGMNETKRTAQWKKNG